MLLFVCGATQIWAGTKMNERPKLVVGIVVDQMRWDYLPRYYDQFGDDGFKRLIEDGFSCDNCLINYLPIRVCILVRHLPYMVSVATTSSSTESLYIVVRIRR